VCEAVVGQSDFNLVPVCREGEAIAVAVGLMLGGKEPVVVHQNTGFLDSGDSVRSLALDLQLPLLLLIGYRGWRRDSPLTDSAAIFTEPILDAWGIKHYLLETDADVERISLGFKEAHETQKPVVILIGREVGEL
jgi:sulfopyruvate decarboxylase TPP-binding subunit